MKSLIRALLATSLITAIALPAAAATNELRAAKVGGKDPAEVEAVAKFYTSLFGLQEIERRTRATDKNFLEIIMNYGATPAAAKAKAGAHVTVVTTPGMAKHDPVPHLVLNVPDDKAVMEKVVAAGGKVDRGVQESASGSNAFLWDPADNRIEIVTPRAAPAKKKK